MIETLAYVAEARQWELLRETWSATGAKDGVFVSVVSLFFVMAGALRGASPGSSTHSELLSFLGGALKGKKLSEGEVWSCLVELQGQLSGASNLTLANSVWVNGVPLLESFVEDMARDLQAPVRNAHSVGPINAWCSDVTKGLIPMLLDPGTHFKAILANALYFKGQWVVPFDHYCTRPYHFTSHKGNKKLVTSMGLIEAAVFPYLHVEGSFEAVRLDYKGGDFFALALLPQEGQDLGDMIADDGWPHLTAEQWNTEVWPKHYVDLRLPKFSIEHKGSLMTPLKELGLRAMFAGGEFSRMSPQSMSFTEVVQQVVVKVDEEGTEAAAATAGVMDESAGHIYPDAKVLYFTRPFFFGLYHSRSHIPLISGLVLDLPEWKATE